MLKFPKWPIFNRYHSKIFVRVGHETTYVDIGNHHFFTIPVTIVRATKIIKESVKPVHECYLCTGFTEALNNFGSSDDDMV